ncbi:MAG: hypothetical protein DMG18_09915 [Acidobacteria bacterium]|nr:MAG: hypothetical protein DMG18_09915 [Acidobacteriota bacterium]
MLVFFNALIATAAFLFVYRLCLEATDKVRIAALVALLAAIGNYSTLRPQTFSFFMFAAYSWTLSGYRFRRRDALWTLPVLMIFWVNLHGAFVLGLGLVAIYAATEGCRRFIDPQRTDALTAAELRKLLLVLLLCGLATFINPETYKVYHYVYTVVTDPASQQFVTEWQPPQVNQVLGIMLFYAPFFLGLLILAYSRIKPDLTEIALFFGFAVFAMMSTRNAAWFGTATDDSPAFSCNRPVFSSVRGKFSRKACLQPAQCRDRRARYWRLDRSISVDPAQIIQGSTVGQANTSRSGRIHRSARTGWKHFSSTDLR